MSEAPELWVPIDKPKGLPVTTALVIVDMIRATVDAPGSARVGSHPSKENDGFYEQVTTQVVPNIQRLLQTCRELGRMIIHVRPISDSSTATDWPRTFRPWVTQHGPRLQGRGTRENDFIPAVEPMDGEAVVEKRSISAFNSTGLETILYRHGITHLIVTGVATHLAVGHTITNATDRNFLVVLPEDATCAYNQTQHREWVSLYQEYYFRQSSTAEVEIELRESKG